VGDCSVSLSQAEDSGLILSARVGKHTDELIEELVVSRNVLTDFSSTISHLPIRAESTPTYARSSPPLQVAVASAPDASA